MAKHLAETTDELDFINGANETDWVETPFAEMVQGEKDLCKTCEHYWLDFPLPLDCYVPHCEIVDEKAGFKSMEEAVPYPCLKCPFNRYSPSKEKKC